MNCPSALCLTALLLHAPAAAQEDVLCLKDGRVFANLEIERTESGVTVHFENGDVKVAGDLILDAF